MSLQRNLTLFNPVASESVFAFLCFGPGGKQYPDYFEKWIATNRDAINVFVILTDSAFATTLSDGSPGYTATLIANKETLERKYQVKIDIVDIRECKQPEQLNYVNWLIDHVSLGHEKKPAYAFISDASRYVGLSVLTERYPLAKKIFLAEADTHGIRQNFLGEDHQIEMGFKFFGDDRALMLLRNDGQEGKEILNKFLRIYANFYTFIFNRNHLNLSLSPDLIYALMTYSRDVTDDAALLTHLGEHQSEYSSWRKSTDQNSEKLLYILINICGGQSRFIFQDQGIGAFHSGELDQNDIGFDSLSHEQAVSESRLGYWHDAYANWRGLMLFLEAPERKYLSEKYSRDSLSSAHLR